MGMYKQLPFFLGLSYQIAIFHMMCRLFFGYVFTGKI